MQPLTCLLLSCSLADTLGRDWIYSIWMWEEEPLLNKRITNGQHAHTRDLCVGQRVLVHNFRPDSKWLSGTVVERTGPLSYRVQVAGDRIWSRHVDHLLQSMDTPQRVLLENPAEPCPLKSDPSLPVPPPDRAQRICFTHCPG